MYKNCFSLCLASGLPFLVSATQALAAAGLEEIVVTAQKRAESLQDVPVAISAFTEETMRNMGIANAQDLQAATPGLVYSSLGTLGSPFLRGVGSRLTLNGLDSSVATYVGERYIPRGSGNQLELGLDVERVEILKGPQGILYGRNATGGAIRVIKKSVADEFEGTVRAKLGNFDYREVAGTVSIPLSDTFGMRLSGQSAQRDAWQDNLAYGVDPVAVNDINNKDVQKLTGAFRWYASERTTVNLNLDYWAQDDYQGHDGSLLGPPQLNVGVALLGGIHSTDRDHAGTETFQPTDGGEQAGELNIEHTFDGFDLTSITTYADFDMKWTSEGDGSSARIFDPAIAYDESETWSQEFRLASNSGDTFDWTAGAFYYEDVHSSEFLFDSVILGNVSQGRQTTETTAAALYGHLGWQLNQSWALKMGARYSYENRAVDMIASNRGRPTLGAALLPFTPEESWNEITPLVTLEYTMDNAMVYLTYTRGFKSGGYNYPAYSTPDGLDPEILDMYELGLKGEYLDGTLRLNTAIFYYDYSDLQVTRAAVNSAATTVENAADSTVMGLDMDITWLVTEALTINAGLNLLDSEYKDYNAAPRIYNAILDGTIGSANPSPGMGIPNPTNPNHAPFNQFSADGESLLRAPDLSYYVTIGYEIFAGEGRIPLSVTYSYKDDYEFDFAVDPIAKEWLHHDSYGLLSARISYYAADDKWSVAAWGNNLTDEEYFNEVAGNAMGLRGFWALPRTYGVEVAYNF